MTATPEQAAARAEVAGRLAAFRLARLNLHADIHRAAQLGMTTTEIARACGMTWHGVKKILARRPTTETRPTRAATDHSQNGARRG